MYHEAGGGTLVHVYETSASTPQGLGIVRVCLGWSDVSIGLGRGGTGILPAHAAPSPRDPACELPGTAGPLPIGRGMLDQQGS
jgi:hypothetical protein